MFLSQEVSCFGDESKSDEGDVWMVELEGGKEVWEVNGPMRLLHIQTGAYLITHDKKFGRPIAGQQEVAAIKGKSALSLFQASEGVYFPSPAALQ